MKKMLPMHRNKPKSKVLKEQIFISNDLRQFYAKGTTVPSGKKMDPICMCRYIMLVVSKVWYETNDRMAISED